MKQFKFDKFSFKKLWKRGGALFVIIELSFIAMSIIVWILFVPVIREARISELQTEIEKSVLQIDRVLATWNSSFHKGLLRNIDNLQKRRNIDTLCKECFNSFSTLQAATIQYRNDTTVYSYCPSATDQVPKFELNSAAFDKKVCQNNVSDFAIIHGIQDSVAMVVSFGVPLYGGDSADVLITLYSDPQSLSECLLQNVPDYINSRSYFIDNVNNSILIGDTIENKIDMMPYFRQTFGDEIASFIYDNEHSPSCQRMVSDGKVCYIGSMTIVPRAVCIVVPISSFTVMINRITTLYILFTIIVAFFISIVCIKHIRRQTREDVSRLVGKREMEFASSVQQSMLSKPMCNEPSVDLSSRFISAKAVGGDLYYFYERNGLIYFCIGDVSSKGVPAAMYMSRVLSSFRNAIRYSVSSSDIAEQMNEELCLDNDQMMFVTIFIGVFKIKTGELNYCNAGHEKPLLWSGKEGEKPCYLTSKSNVPMGIDANWRFLDDTITLSIGAKITLYTDGVTEAMNVGHEMFGTDRLYNLFCSQCGNSSDQLNQALVDAIAGFTKQAEQSDDIAILSFCVKPLNETISFSLDYESLRQLQPVFIKLGQILNIDKHQLYDMHTAIDEMVTNVIKHGFSSNDKEPDITLRIKVEHHRIYFILRNNGDAFNPLTYKPAERDMTVENFTIGGLGISMMLATFQYVDYNREDGYNILTMSQDVETI